MTRFKHDPFADADFSNYQNWQQVTLPTGEAYYVIPGHPGYLFDPVASEAAGHHVYRSQQSVTDDAQRRTDQQTQRDVQNEQIKQAKNAGSLQGQITPVLGATAGTVGTAYLINQMPKTPSVAEQVIADELKRRAAAETVNKVTPQVTTQGQAAAQGSQGVPALSSSAPVPVQVGWNADGTPIYQLGDAPTTAIPGGAPATPQIVGANGVPAPTSWYMTPGSESTLGTIGSAAAAAKGAYDVFNATQNGGAGLRTGLGELGSGVGMYFGGPVGALAGAAAGSLGGYAYQNRDNVRGLSAGVAPFLAFKAMDALGLGMHKTTRQVAGEHTAELLNQGQNDPTYQTYVQGMRQQYNAPPPDPSKPFHAGQYSSWDEYQKAGLDASDLTGVYGNLKTYGPKWASLTEDQRRAVTQANIEGGLYTSKKGEVEITDPAKALQNYDNVMKGFQVGSTMGQAAAQGATAPVVAAPVVTGPTNVSIPGAVLKRSTTISPGIGLNGQPVYVRR